MRVFFHRVRLLSILAFNWLTQGIRRASCIITVLPSSKKYESLCRTQFKTVIDCGAHMGEFAGLIHKLLPDARILSFEPLPKPFKALRAFIATCPASSEAYNIALGDSDGETTIDEYPFTQCSSLLKPHADARTFFPYMIGAVRRPVSVRTLDGILAGRTIERPALLKIDVQGYECHVLRGAKKTLQNIDAVLVETSFVRLYQDQPFFAEVKTLLESLGFRYAGNVYEHTAFFSTKIAQEDSLFVRQVS